MKNKSTQTNTIALNGHQLFYRYRPGDSDVFISFLHGYPTSSLDYAHLLDQIPEEYHVIAHDHLGFGASDKPTAHNYLISDQADFACELYNALGARNIHIVAHDYGTSVATEIIARNNEKQIDFNIKTMTLCNGSMLIDMAKLRIIQRLLKSRWTGNLVAHLSSGSTFHRNMKNIFYDKSLYHRDKMQPHWELLISGNGRNVLPKITRYIDQRYTFYSRWIGALQASELPFHILWAENDPVAVLDMASALDEMISDSELTTIQECGRYPMIEKSEEWLDAVLNYISNYP